MVDLHHHLLFGLDDGSPDLATSVEMARMATADGITHVVATPHASGRYLFSPEKNAERASVLQQALTEASIPLQVGLACDFHMSYDNIRDAVANPRKYTINGSHYLLIELPDHAIPLSLGESIHELRVAGMTPILTHPERNPTLQRHPERLAEWMRNGLLTQITTSSILGQMGKPAEQMARTLLSNRWVHFLATDAHNLTTRPPKMKAACEAVANRYGSEYAQRLCTTNPLAVFEGRPLPQQDEPRNLFDDDDRDDRPWWQKLFKR